MTTTRPHWSPEAAGYARWGDGTLTKPVGDHTISINREHGQWGYTVVLDRGGRIEARSPEWSARDAAAAARIALMEARP